VTTVTSKSVPAAMGSESSELHHTTGMRPLSWPIAGPVRRLAANTVKQNSSTLMMFCSCDSQLGGGVVSRDDERIGPGIFKPQVAARIQHRRNVNWNAATKGDAEAPSTGDHTHTRCVVAVEYRNHS
jgi:hypothetical protein